MAENSKEFLLNFKNKLEIDTSGSKDLDQIASARFEPLAAG
ncbi:MAG: capsid protein, partial [Enterococcus sp.]